MRYIYHAHAIYQLSEGSMQHFDGIVVRAQGIDETNYKEVKKAIAAEMGVKDGDESKVIVDSLTYLGRREHGVIG